MKKRIAVTSLVVLSACGSSGGSGAGSDPTSCDGRAPLSGGLDRTLDISACGSGGSTMTMGEGITDGVSIRFDLGRELDPNEVGTIPAAKTTLTARTAGGQEVWEAGAGVCSIKLDSRARDEKIGLDYGTGTASCSGPLAPAAGNTKGPVTVGTISFTALVPSKD